LEHHTTGAIHHFEEVDYETLLLQGEHELRSGDATRALRYLTLVYKMPFQYNFMIILFEACENSQENNAEAFALR